MLDCNQVRREIDSAFDEGGSLDGAVLGHLVQCGACAAYESTLRSLDSALRCAEPLQPDPRLVARIQAAIAQQPQPRPRAWIYPALAAAAAMVMLVALGSVVDWAPVSARVSLQSWIPDEPLLPDAVFLKEELVGIPDAVATDMSTFARAVEANWAALRVWQATASGGHNPFIWAIFIVCMVAAFALDGREWMARHINRPGHG